MPQALTVAQVADRLNVNQLTIRRMLNDGRLTGFRVGRNWRVDPDVLEAFTKQPPSSAS